MGLLGLRSWRVIFALGGGILFGPALAHATCDVPVGRFVSITGLVSVQGAAGGQWVGADLSYQLCEGDTIRVSDRSRAAVTLINDAVLRIGQNTTMRLLDITDQEEESSWLDVVKGAFQSFSRRPTSLKVNTPYLNGSVEGTEFLVRVEADATTFTVFEGMVVAANERGKLTVVAGETAHSAKGQAPERRILVRPRDQVSWALYYPPILFAPPPATVSPNLIKAANCAANNNPACAFAALDDVPARERDAQFYLQRASVLLSVGRVDEARADIDEMLRGDPNAGAGYALRAVIAVAQNQNETALGDARRGVELSPESTAAKIALSYALQANLQLEAARDTLLQAAEQQPGDALAWARLAELHLTLGDRRAARSAAERAVQLQPGLSRTQNVRGFAALAETRTNVAQEAFVQAIAYDSADPLPRLGLGLAKIRQGQFEEGRRDLEVAVALDSNNALLRPYLGKAYFEEKRGPLDADQFAVAKTLDPQDPTPYLYDAIRKQTENDPVGALGALNASIERNDNRAVYRSRLLLDSDVATRSASLGRVYNELGFEQRALVEGWKSVNTDPSNASAHRFLADSYRALPRHEIARVSELLQSQLLQPLNVAPIQPRSAEGNLFLISAAGPATAALNEFFTLFNRNRTNVLVDGMVGESDTHSGDLVVSGIHDKLSYSVGASTFRTDGFRQNSDQEDDIANAFFQFSLSPETSVQFEYRYRDLETGDLQLNFFDEDFRPKLNNQARTDTYRVGLRHMFSPASVLLGSFTYQEDDTKTTDDLGPGLVDNILVDIREPDNEGVGGELQYLYRLANLNVTAGAGYFDLDRSQVTSVSSDPLTCAVFGTCGEAKVDLDAKHTNLYLYTYFTAPTNLIWTLGFSGDLFDTEDSSFSKSNDQFNPKLGVTWDITPATTVRAAAFRAFKRTLITQQTLEPTQVAGFNQFYDDIESTDSWRYGVAVDQKFSDQVFGGVELSKRELDVPIQVFSGGSTSVVTRDWDERFARLYLYATPYDWMAASLEYQYEAFERPDSGSFSLDAKTHRVPIGLRLFEPTGWALKATATYINQDGKFQRSRICCESGSDDFWLLDASVSYRLPKRYGFLTFGVTNLFDKDFSYQETDFNNPTIQPERRIFGRVSLALP